VEEPSRALLDAESQACYIANMRYEEDRLDRLERLVAELIERVDALDARTGAAAAPPRPPARAAEPTRDSSWREKVDSTAEGEGAIEPLAAETAGRRVPEIDLEDLLGRRVLGWLGAIAVVLGVAFFLATAISRGWIDETTRVALAYAGSTALLAVGLFLYERQGRTQAALAAVASAIAALYLSTTAATTLYDLVSPVAGLGVAGLTGAVATAIAVRWQSPIVAGIGIVGALLAPVLVDAGTSGVALAFMAVALVSATGVLVWQRWDWLAAAAFLASAPQLAGWLIENHDESLALALVVLALFWALYVVAALGYELRVRTERLRLSSASLLLADAVFTAGAGWLALEQTDHGDGATAWVVGTAVAHVVLGSATIRGRISREIALLLLAVGIGLSAIGLALALDGPVLVAAWSVEAVLLAWLARRTGQHRAYVAAGGFLLAAVVHVLAFDAPPEELAEEPSWRGVVAVALVTAAAAVGSWLARGERQEAVTIGESVAVLGLAYLAPTAFEGTTVVLAWALAAVALAFVGSRGLSDVAAITAPAFVVLALLHVLAVEAPPSALREGVDDLAAAALAIAAAAASAVGVARLTGRPRDIRLPLELAGGALAVYLPSVAIVDLTTTGEVDPGQTPQVLLSAFWSATGLAALVYGLLRDERRFRLGGLALLGIAIVKVYLYDLAELDEIYRVLSFIALGLLLLASAFAYQRIRRTSEPTH
jgi:uncharacterized membrane protein